jgi:RES domain-containing protein
VIRAWRLARRVHSDPPATKAFDGYGSELYGNRWNSIGLAAAYASSTRALCALEYLVHVDPDLLPNDLVFADISFAESDVEHIARLPVGWDEEGSATAAAYGDAWLREQRSAVLAVPSVVVRNDVNYVINPRHPDFSTLVIGANLEEFVFDQRLFKIRP